MELDELTAAAWAAEFALRGPAPFGEVLRLAP